MILVLFLLKVKCRDMWISIALGKVCVNLPNIWVNLIFLRKFCKETCCFLEKITQQETILHDRRSRRSRKIPSLIWSSRVDLQPFFFPRTKVFSPPAAHKQRLTVHGTGQSALSMTMSYITKRNHLHECDFFFW